MTRVNVQMGRVSFACEDDELRRWVEFHRPIAMLSSWDGWVALTHIKTRGVLPSQSAAVAAANARRFGTSYKRCRARWAELLAECRTIAEAVEKSGRARVTVIRAATGIGVIDRFPDAGDPKRVFNNRAKWAEAFANAATLQEAADAMGCVWDSARSARYRYGLKLGRTG